MRKVGFLSGGIGTMALMAAMAAPPACAQAVEEQSYALPAQDLSASIREVAQRSGRSIIAPDELISGRRASALTGRYSAAAALSQLLGGSGLQAVVVEGALVISQGEQGRAEAESRGEGEEIVVTGTNLRGAQPTGPLIRIGREEIDRTGATSVEQLMRQVPQNFQGGINQENFRVVGAGADPTENGAGMGRGRRCPACRGWRSRARSGRRRTGHDRCSLHFSCAAGCSRHRLNPAAEGTKLIRRL
jgi:hypothetical protein